MASPAWPQPFRFYVTTHTTTDADGTDVEVLTRDASLRSVLDSKAAISPLFTANLPAHSAHHISTADIETRSALIKGMLCPGGVNGQVTYVKPNVRIDMHRTNSLDFNILIAGTAWLITPTSQADGDAGKEKRVLVRAGEVVVQTGTLHAWESGPEGAEWVSVLIVADPVKINNVDLPEVDFQ